MRKLEEILDEILAEKAKKATCCHRCGRKHVKVQLVKSRISLRIILDTVKINNDPELDLY